MDRLAPIERVHLSQQVTAKIRDYIRDAGLRPGTKLPSERELADRLAVSRGIMREALKALEAVGIVEIRVGFGIYVADTDYGALVRHVTSKLPDGAADATCLIESRLGFECAAIDLAARRATEEDLAYMEECVDRMANGRNLDEVLSADLDFHCAILKASRNPIVMELSGFLRWFFVQGTTELGAKNREDKRWPDILEVDVMAHRMIMEALRAGESEKARRFLSDHLARAMRTAIESDALQSGSPAGVSSTKEREVAHIS